MNIFLDEHTSVLMALNTYEVEYLLIGGYAVVIYGYDRTTGDMDIWLNPTNDNKHKIIQAFESLGYDKESLSQLGGFDFTEAILFMLGTPPEKMEFMTRLSLIQFDESYANREVCELEDGFYIQVISLHDLILSKINTGRTKDQADVEELQKIQNFINKDS